MPKGLELFKKHFAAHTPKYVLIGGTACELALLEAGLTFRATKDLDIVLTVETLDAEFSARFWQFVDEGGYEHQRGDQDGKTQCYRFLKPKAEGYPYMLELFARKSELFQTPKDRPIGLVPADADAQSLSAILMDDDYYAIVENGRKVVDDMCRLDPQSLILLKAKAYLDLSARKKSDERSVKSDDIKKHKNDVFRLWQILAGDLQVKVPASVLKDFASFLSEVERDPPNLGQLGVTGASFAEVLAGLKKIYGV